jgi:hypothetical protein
MNEYKMEMTIPCATGDKENGTGRNRTSLHSSHISSIDRISRNVLPNV